MIDWSFPGSVVLPSTGLPWLSKTNDPSLAASIVALKPPAVPIVPDPLLSVKFNASIPFAGSSVTPRMPLTAATSAASGAPKFTSVKPAGSGAFTVNWTG